MIKYRDHLPQLDGGFFLTDGGLETDLMFNHGIEIREFAAHTLLPDQQGRDALADYLRGYLALARDTGSGSHLEKFSPVEVYRSANAWHGDLLYVRRKQVLTLCI